MWKGPWRFYAESMLDCCTPLEAVQRRGVSFDELHCLALCHGCEASSHRAAAIGACTGATEADLREAVRAQSAREDSFLVASYSRALLGQTGDGHFSPIAAYHAPTDSALVLDVARFKYPPHWVPVPALWAAMRSEDSATNRPRGWLRLSAAPPQPVARGVLAFSSNFAMVVREAVQRVGCASPHAAKAGEGVEESPTPNGDFARETAGTGETGTEHRAAGLRLASRVAARLARDAHLRSTVAQAATAVRCCGRHAASEGTEADGNNGGCDSCRAVPVQAAQQLRRLARALEEEPLLQAVRDGLALATADCGSGGGDCGDGSAKAEPEECCSSASSAAATGIDASHVVALVLLCAPRACMRAFARSAGLEGDSADRGADALLGACDAVAASSSVLGREVRELRAVAASLCEDIRSGTKCGGCCSGLSSSAGRV